MPVPYSAWIRWHLSHANQWLAGDQVDVGSRARDHRHVRALARQGLRDAQADAFRGGGDERHLTRDPEVHFAPS